MASRAENGMAMQGEKWQREPPSEILHSLIFYYLWPAVVAKKSVEFISMMESYCF